VDSIISSYIDNTKKSIQKLSGLSDKIKSAANILIETCQNGGKLIVFGNGGSAADSQHIVTELVSRFRKERPPLRAVALTTNTSILTAVANDYDFSKVFVRQLEAMADKKDAVIAISTSGNSLNVVTAAQYAKNNNLKIIGLTGEEGNKLGEICDILINVPASETSHIQECHITVGHLLCHILEKEFF